MSDSTFELIDGQFRLCQGYADEAISLIVGPEGYLVRLMDLATRNAPVLDTSWIRYNWPVPHVDDLPANRPDMPTDEQLAGPDVAVPTVPDFLDVELPEIPVLPVLEAIAPVVSIPDMPPVQLPEDPGDAPTVSYPDTPNAPSYTLPEFPEIDIPAIPSAPNITIPQFEGELPVIDLAELQNTFFYSEAQYESETLTELKTALATYAADGKTGLPDEIVERIWNQAKLRTESENEKIYEEALSFWAARGFNFPPGMLAARLADARVEISRAMADVNEKLTIEQARLAQENTKFVLDTIVKLEALLMENAGRVADRALEASKVGIQVGVEIYNANIARYNLMLDTYKTAAAVYESRIRAAVMELEEYKSRLEAVKMVGELQMYQVDIYKAQVSGVAAMIELYKSEMQAAEMRLNTERFKLDAYKTTVDVYATKVQAKTAEYNMYQAKIAGEAAKVDLYGKQVGAYSALLDSFKIRIAAATTEAEIANEINKTRASVYGVNIERYKSDVQRAISQVDNLVKAYGLRTEVYDSDIKAATAQASTDVEVYKGRLQQARNQTELALSAADTNLKSFLSNRQLTLEASKDAANVAAQLAASSLSAVHASASGGYSTNVSYDQSKGTPTQSTVYEYIYSE